uniref:Probable G-protein coupled receptor 133-like n=1 Tax=Saccoglossus kowalevskii TaxID=10224 RepID=A0ABM0MMI9_SACKO|nr:PREDICTED: probable G-protein coupled receptor 133-like [Saccoglossus kowalevskii]
MCVAILLHFCYLAVFAWMLVEGIHLYSKVVQVFGSESSKLKYYFLIGWGLPFIIVGISAAANHNGYGTEKHCWLDIASGQIWAFVGPALLIILINLVVLGMVVRIVINSAKMQKEKEYDHIKAGVKGALVLLPLLGLTWVFGLFAVDEGSLVFQYLFAIFNSLQGFFIFLFQCAFNSEVRAAYQRKKEKRALARGEFVTSTSGTHGGYETANRTTKTALTTFSSSDTSDYGRGSPAGLALSRKSSQSSAETLIKDDDSVISTSKVKLKDKHMDTASYKAPSSPLPGTVEEDDDVEIVHC